MLQLSRLQEVFNCLRHKIRSVVSKDLVQDAIIYKDSFKNEVHDCLACYIKDSNGNRLSSRLFDH
jgi:hypothetical protein